MPILNVKPEERKLIPYRLQAAYELGRVSKKELDEYISKGADAYRIAYESNFQPGMLKKPEPVNDGLGSNDWAVPKEDKILIDDAISVNEEMKTLNSEFESAASEDRRLAYLDALANDPGFFESEFEKAKSTPTLETQKAPGVPDFSDYSFIVQKDKEEADRLNATGELWNRRNKALSRQGGINQKINDAQFKIKGIEDYFAEKGAYGQRLLADVGSNKESLYPLAGGIIGGAIGGPEGATLGSALGSVPMFNLAFNAAYTTARRGGVSDVEARDYAMTMAGSEAFIEAVAGKFGAGSKVARNVFGDTLEKRFGEKVAQAALSEGFEEVLTSTAQEALGAGTLTSDQSSEELKKIVAGNVPMRDDGTIDWGAYAGGKAREFAAGAVAGGALRGVAAPTEIRAENQNQRARETVAKQDIARLKQSLESQGVRGTNLTRLLDQRASQVASQLGLDKGATFTREDIAPTEVNVSEDVTRRTQEMLAGDVKLGKDDAFTLGQMSTMQNVEVGKPTLSKTLQEALQRTQSGPATTLPTLDQSFTVEAPTQSQPQVTMTLGKPRANLTERTGKFEPVEMAKPTKATVTSTEGLDLGKASSSAREKLLADVQKAASRPELTDKQKKAVEKRGQSMNEFADLAQRELEFENAFVGKTDDQMAEMIRSRTLAHLQSGKKVEELNTAFNESIKGKPSARKAELNEAEMYLQDSDTTLKRLAKSVDQETIDTLVGRGDVVVKPTFKDLVVDGKVADGNQGFWRSKDGKLYLNAEALGKKNDNAELAYAVLGHELSHGLHAKERKQGEFTNTVKNLLGDSGHVSLVTKIKEVAGQNNALGKLATRAVTRATEAKPDAPDLEIAQYFIEELLANDTVPRGQFRKYIDNMVSTARDVVSQFGIKLDIRPKDIEYIIRKELKNQAKNGPVRGVSGKSETLQSVVYTVNSARARAEKDKQFMDPLYNMRAVEVSDKNASLNPNKIVAGTTMNLGEVMNHKELYDYVPRLKNAKLETDPNMKYGEASYDPLSNIVTVSQQSVDSLKSAMARGTGDNAMYRAKTKEIISSIIHETQHGIQSASTPLAKGTSPSNEAMRFEKRANLTKIQREKAGKSGPMTPAQKELLKENAAWWMYMANAGEVQSRAVQAVYAGKYDNYQDALAAISKQFKFLITDAKSQEAFIDWYNENAGTMADPTGDLLFSRAENTSTKAFKDWFGDSKVVDKNGDPLVVYHGTQEVKRGVEIQDGKARQVDPELGFNVFDMPSDGFELGSHFGTEKQAKKFGPAFPFYLSIKNPLRLPDLGRWNYQSVMREAMSEGVKITEAEYNSVFDARDNNAALRNLLERKGFDGVVYKNMLEGKGDSYIAFRPEQIKSVNNQGTFDPSNPDILMSRADDLKQLISDTFKSVTTGIAPKDMRIIMETADNSVKLHEAKMVGASHNLVQAAKKNNVPWADVEDGWQRMIKNKTLDANTGSQPVDEALARMRVAIDDLSRGLIAAYDSSGVPMSTKLKNTIANNINQYISRSFDINADRNYGKKLLEAAKSNPEKKQLLQDLHDFLGKQASELRNVPRLTDKRVKEIHNRLFGTGGKIDKQRADLTKFAGTRKQEEITDALVNDVLRIGNQTKIAGYYSGLSKNEGILKRRDVIPEIIRKVWGERTGVIEAAMTTVVRQGRLLAETEMQANLLRLMPDRFSTSATNTLTEQLEENVSKYGPMSGMYTDPEMAKVIKSRADTAEKIDSDLFDVHDAKINFAALGKKLRNADRTYRKVIGLYKMTTVLGELSNYLYNVLGAAQAATMRSLGGDLAFLNEDGTKTPLKDWSPQFVKDVWSGKVDDKSTPIYQAMIKHGNLQTSLLGDIQDAFDDATRQRGGFKDKKDKFVHVINSAFSSPEATSSALSFANEMNFLKSFWDAEGKKYTYEDLVMAAADRSKTGTISRDRALRAARLADMYGATTYATFFSETFRAPIANIWQAINTVKEAKTPESKKLAQAYATKQIAGASIMLASGLAIHGAAAMLVKALGGHAFGDEPDEIEEALPEGMRSSADNLLVIGEQPGGAKITYDPSMLNTYSALYDPLASALSGKFEQAGDQILQLAFINPLIRKAIGVANGEGKEVSNETTGFLNEVMADAGLSDLVTPGVVNKGASLVSGLEPSWMAPMVQLGYAKATGKSDEAVKDFGGGLAASAFALGARPFRYAPRKALPGAVAGFQENIKDAQNTLNKVVRDKNNGEDTIRKAAQRFYQAEREALVELRPYVVAAMANGMSEKELKQMIGKGFRKNLRESLMDGNWHPTQMTESWLELSYLSNQQNLSDKEREELLNGYRRNRQVFFEEYKNIFSGGNKQ